MVRTNRSRSTSRDERNRRRNRSRHPRRSRSRSSNSGSETDDGRSLKNSSRYSRSLSREDVHRSRRIRSRSRSRRNYKRSRSRSPRYRHRSRSSQEALEKSGTPPILDGKKMIADTLANIALAKLNYKVSSDSANTDNSKKRKKSRWDGSIHDKIYIPGMPTTLPSNLDKNQEQAYLLQLQIEELTRRLRSGDLGIPVDTSARSPSPEPIYSNEGKRLNTREYRTRKRLEEERHNLILKMQSINPEFKPPMDYKPQVSKVSDQVMIPQDDYPEINFVGLLIGPRGNTLKLMEKETGAKIIIRGKGSVKEGKVGRKDGHPLPGEDEPLHAYISAANPESVKKAVTKIKEIIRQGVETPEDQNHLRRMQLRELALLNGTLREDATLQCSNCGASTHKTWMCPDKQNVTASILCSNCGAAGHIARDCLQKEKNLNALTSQGASGERAPKLDDEYRILMSELSVETQPTQNKIPTDNRPIQVGSVQQPMAPLPAIANRPSTVSLVAGNVNPNFNETWISSYPTMNATWTAPVAWNGAPVPGSSNVLDPRLRAVAVPPPWPLYQQPPPNYQLPPPPGVDVTSFMCIPPPPPPPKS